MCGIFAYAGRRAKESSRVCLEALRKLEYRGYDSAGIAGHNKTGLAIYKCVGNVAALSSSLPETASKLGLTIAHTRWATHGEISLANAHPQMDSFERVAVVHNGIIDNFSFLKQFCITQGISFTSETDTEVIAQLFSLLYDGDLRETLRKTFVQLEGSFAFLLIHQEHPECLVMATRNCPLIIAQDPSSKEIFASSDIHAFSGKDLEILFLESNQLGYITGEEIEIEDALGGSIEKKSSFWTSHEELASKEGFSHYLLKEIYEQPAAIRRTLQNHLDLEKKNYELDLPPWVEEALMNAGQLLFVGCGTAFHAASIGALLSESLAKISSKSWIASEFRYASPVLDDKTILIAISQSGETADTLAAVREAKKKGILILALCNVGSSTLAREAHHTLLLAAGPEMSVCSTKAFTCQLLVLLLLLLSIASKRHLPEEENQRILQELQQLPHQLEKLLEKAWQIEEIAKQYAHFQEFIFIGRQLMSITALEAALKLKEISYVPAVGYPAGELKHGPIARIDESVLTIALFGDSRTAKKLESNLAEINARNGPIFAIVSEDQEMNFVPYQHLFRLPHTPSDLLAPIFYAVVTQLFAYYVATLQGANVDQPRNLAKSVTVE